MPYTLAQTRKAAVALATFVVTTATVALEGELFPQEWTPYVVGVITLAGAYGVFAARNDRVPTRHARILPVPAQPRPPTPLVPPRDDDYHGKDEA